MVKLGSKHKTTAFGTDAERYLANLYDLNGNVRCSSRPDLSHPRKLFSVEVKSGLDQGILIMEQMAYHFTNPYEIVPFFGDDSTDVYLAQQERNYSDEGERLFYSFVERTNRVAAVNFQGDFSAATLTWEDQYIIPSEVIFHYFAASLATQQKTTVKKALGELRSRLTNTILHGEPAYKNRKGPAWQGLRFRAAKAIVERDFSGLRNKVQIRTMNNFRKSIESNGYEDFLTRSTEGPNGSTVHMVYPRKDAQKVVQIRRSVTANKKKLEAIAQERRDAIRQLGSRKLHNRFWGDYHNGGLDEERRTQLVNQGIRAGQIDRLERLCYWMDESDWQESLAEIPF